jgi:nucleotide-binding universal stress UspA family protein
MPLILVATDFSATSTNAAHYAASLAQSRGYGLLLLHAYFIPVTFNDPAMPILPIDELREASNARMSRAVDTLQAAFPGLVLQSRVAYGDIQDCLEEVVGELQPELLVIGSHSEEDSFWTGSTAADLLRNTQTAILAVPAGYPYRPVAQLCIALEAQGIRDEAPFQPLQALLGQEPVIIHLLHIPSKDEAAAGIMMEEKLPLFAAGRQVVFHTGTEGDVDEQIAAYVTSHAIDWLIVVPHQYGFWDSMFHKSHTKAMVYKSPVPVLALH